jgi:hypothetical protein
LARVYSLNERYPEGDGFARAGARLADDVTPSEERRNSLRLDGRRSLDAHLRERAQGGASCAELGKG